VGPQPDETPTSAADRAAVVREVYGAYASGDRSALARHLAPDFTFYSPADVGIDLETYYERCWPNAELIAAFEFTRLIASGDEVLVTYEATRTDETRFRNTEVLTFAGASIIRAEVYFGWEVP
jgi:ketosteroid isomerase-like protein